MHATSILFIYYIFIITNKKQSNMEYRKKIITENVS